MKKIKEIPVDPSPLFENASPKECAKLVGKIIKIKLPRRNKK